MIRSAFKLLLILLLTAMPLHALAATYYVATTGNDSTGDGSLGNPWASPGKATGAITTDDTIYLKSGTYTVTSSSANVSNGRIAPTVRCRMIGYVTTTGDAVLWGTMPSIRAGVSGISPAVVTCTADDCSFENIEVDGNLSSFNCNGFNSSSSKRIRLYNTRAKNCTFNSYGNGNSIEVWFGESVSCSATGFQVGGFCCGCLSRAGASHGMAPNTSGTLFVGCAQYGNAGYGVATGAGSTPPHLIGGVSYGNTQGGVQVDVPGVVVANYVTYGNGSFGFVSTAARNDALIVNCAGGGNTGGNFHSTDIPAANQISFVTLTADPFVNASGLNFALNSTAGGGALLRSAGLGAFPGSATTGYPDIGVARHQDPAGSSPLIRSARRGLSP